MTIPTTANPRVPADVCSAVVQNDIIALSQAGHHRLIRAPISLLWPMFDGTTSIATLAGDAAATFDVPVEKATNDLLRAVRDLVGVGLLTTNQKAPVIAPFTPGHASPGDVELGFAPDWIAPLHLKVAGTNVTVRCDDVATLETITDLFQAWVAQPDTEAETMTLGLSVNHRYGAAPVSLPQLSADNKALLSSGSVARLLRRLNHALAALATDQAVPAAIRFPSLAAISSSDGSVLVPASVVHGSQFIEDELVAHGLRITEAGANYVSLNDQFLHAAPGLVAKSQTFQGPLAPVATSTQLKSILWSGSLPAGIEGASTRATALLAAADLSAVLDRASALATIVTLAERTSGEAVSARSPDIGPIIRALELE